MGGYTNSFIWMLLHQIFGLSTSILEGVLAFHSLLCELTHCFFLSVPLFPIQGTTKRKELHGTTCIHALSGSWGAKCDGTTFHAYKFDFSCSIVTEIYSGFILLIESKLDDDVGNIELDLYLVAKIVKSYISSCGEVYLDAAQVLTCRVLIISIIVLLILVLLFPECCICFW